MFRTFLNKDKNLPAPPVQPKRSRPETHAGRRTAAGKNVTPETAQSIAAAYRCINILCDDVAKMPLQTFVSDAPGDIKRLVPDGGLQNIAWRLEVSPNRWMSPSVFKKTLMRWLLCWGNAYIWQPVGMSRELFILSADTTYPTFDMDGNLWYATRFPNGQSELIPGVEVLPLMINTENGFTGRSVITFARETLARQMGAHESENKLQAQGFTAAAVAWVDGEADKDVRERIREAYTEAVSGSEGYGRIAILDNKFKEFKEISLKATDMQFLERVQATDAEIANFFGMPLHKLNMGKQSYESNEQQQLDYLSTTLDPYLVQIEEAGKLKWLARDEQGNTYFRFERSALFRTDAKTRGEYLNGAIQNARLSPNEARQVEDRPAFKEPGADKLYIPANLREIGAENGDPNVDAT